jgi:hypothetical protein
MNALSPHMRLRRRERILKQEADGTVVLLSLHTGRYFALNEVGGRIWELCDGSRTVSETAAIISLEYEAPLDVVERDLTELLTNLIHENLVEQNPA